MFGEQALTRWLIGFIAVTITFYEMLVESQLVGAALLLSMRIGPTSRSGAGPVSGVGPPTVTYSAEPVC
jgi:hypothetical protein